MKPSRRPIAIKGSASGLELACVQSISKHNLERMLECFCAHSGRGERSPEVAA